MKFLIVLAALLVVAAAQFGQQFRSNGFNSQRAFLRFDDDFDDFDDHDSLEDLYEDLYDDDADDRAEARAALTRLRASGAITGNAFRNNRFINNRRPTNNAFRSTGFTNNGFVNRFSNNNQRNNFGTNFNTPRPFVNTFSTNPNNFNRNGVSSTTTGFNSFANNRFNNNGFQSSGHRFSGPNNNGFGQPLFSTNTVNTNSNPFPNKRSSSFTSLNSIRPSGISKSTSPSGIKTLPNGINWPGGNGYFFSMSSNGGAPVSYFISYDD
ncbi:dr1-associated corepressor homolog isoform X1 [Macrobrachium rosenbergii]|uniref:dr1-associated corepressor homolog isoform X1 n=1 Tax=Macrobrachium rosenbergii TaxID=79674 RepID=UPI0034D64A53